MLIYWTVPELTYNIDLLNNVKRILKVISNDSTGTNLEIFSMIIRKDKKKIQKNILETNTRLKIFCLRKGICYIKSSIIKEVHVSKT